MKSSKTTKEKIMDLKHFVTFFFEQEKNKTVRVDSNEISQFDIPEGVYGFKVFDQPSSNIYKSGKIVVGINDIINEKTYLIGKVVTLDDVKNHYGEESETYLTYLERKYYGAVKSPSNYFAPLRLNQLINIITPEQLASFRSAQEQEIEAEA